MDEAQTQGTENGYSYGKDIIDLFKFGVGQYYGSKTAEFESKARFDLLNGQLYQNGMPAGMFQSRGGVNMLPWIIGGVALVAVVLLVKK